MAKLTDINNSFESYQRLIDFYLLHKGKYFEEIYVEFGTWFSANMCAALGAMLDKIASNNNNITIEQKKILLKNDFLAYYGHKRLMDSYHTTIRFLKLKPTDGKFFNNYVINELLQRNELPEMSHLVKEKMAEGIYEIFVNAQIHSKSKQIYTCGQFFPSKNMIEFTIVDTGIGFKKIINDTFKRKLSAAKAIQWATKDKHTTKIGITGGLGLSLLKEFIDKNKGKLQIISDDGFYQFDCEGEQIATFKGSFPGTIVNLQFKTNDISSYILSQEVSNNDIF